MNFLNRKYLTLFVLVTSITLLGQNQAFADRQDDDDNDNIQAIANWAQINYPNDFYNQYNDPNVPLQGDVYRYVCFEPSENCIGITRITEDTILDPQRVDVYLNGEVHKVNTLEKIKSRMADSKNGILNFYARPPVRLGPIPSVFSPGLGKVVSKDGVITGVRWEFSASSLYKLEVGRLPGSPAAVSSLVSFFTNSGSSVRLQKESSQAIQGLIIDTDKRTLKITEDVEIQGNILIRSGTLKF